MTEYIKNKRSDGDMGAYSEYEKELMERRYQKEEWKKNNKIFLEVLEERLCDVKMVIESYENQIEEEINNVKKSSEGKIEKIKNGYKEIMDQNKKLKECYEYLLR